MDHFLLSQFLERDVHHANGTVDGRFRAHRQDASGVPRPEAIVPLVFPFHFSVGGFRSMRPLALAAWAALRAMPARSFGDSTLARRYPPIRPARAFMALRARPSGVWCARISAWRSSSGRCLKGSVNGLLLVTQPHRAFWAEHGHGAGSVTSTAAAAMMRNLFDARAGRTRPRFRPSTASGCF